ncbi:hypothetical protein D0T49_06100 [Paludibacter sp. 221]|uniref:DUF6051 family protein n=1 Tax=Paludibacter sp. 221 TaxID=2302939 RepID=UPI0013D7E9EF|nr:DUF6051 family protein [Paludibacter sp. 221]NDV46615.1 hypothetical protein [Paludibacter sp. 221]
MDYSERHNFLESQFSLGQDCYIKDSDVNIRFFHFNSTFRPLLLNSDDELIKENTSFVYPVFYPANETKMKQAIVLLHGLNERKWNKYLTWAEYLCKKTEKAVILFPIAFHMNRSPNSWSNPHEMNYLLNLRKQKNGNDRFLTVANVALSERICEHPLRFYASGKQSLIDLEELFGTIKKGEHPLFGEGTRIDIFAYSIGAFLSQVALMADKNNLFSDSKLFMFCGGSIFSSMFGKSRSIIDSLAFDSLINYYLSEFPAIMKSVKIQDETINSFYSMIAPEWNKTEREDFFRKSQNRIRGISLAKDTVIPYDGVLKAMGEENARSQVEITDFDYDYSHEMPFPLTGKTENRLINHSFEYIFSQAAQFLS